MSVTILVGDAIMQLRTRPSDSVHMCVSSPPYYGKRDYGVPPSVWGGDEACAHRWGEELLDRSKRSPGTQGGSLTGDGRYQANACRFEIRSNFCVDCGAWRGALGLEPTPDLYVEHLVAVFEEVRRVLRPDGVLFLNLGDTYATGAGRVGDHPGGGEQGQRWKGGAPSESSTLQGNGHVGGGPKLKNLAPVPREDVYHRGYRGERIANGRGDPPAVLRKKTRATRDGTHADKNTAVAARGPMTQPNRMPLPGFKPKDLLGIPWRVAMALQAPRYTGRIKSELDRVWLAAMIEGDGCIYISRSAAGSATGRKKADGSRSKRSADCFGPGIRLCNTDEALVRRCHQIARMGTVRKVEKVNRQRVYWEWCVWSDQARQLLAEIYPHLVAKHYEARLAFATPSSGAQAEAAWLSLKSIHQGQEPTVDFKPPPALWREGWWLRGENIWAKPNPMPESISDRCTTSHEQVFLLAKGARYFYDATAVAEPANYAPGCGWEEEPKGTRGGKRGVPQGRAIDPEQSFRAIRATRNKRTVWTIATTPFPGAHFATFPPKLVEPCVLAGTSERGCCVTCSAPWERVEAVAGSETLGWWPSCHCEGLPRLTAYPKKPRETDLDRWRRECAAVDDHRRAMCEAERNRPTRPAVVMDPFGGAGTTAMVADRLQRAAIIIELNPEYAAIARSRLEMDAGMFARAAE